NEQHEDDRHDKAPTEWRGHLANIAIDTGSYCVRMAGVRHRVRQIGRRRILLAHQAILKPLERSSI
ncbi:unnamed protein product, partial [marine sediment metagenome]